MTRTQAACFLFATTVATAATLLVTVPAESQTAGSFVALQPNSPGVLQQGNTHISGTAIAGDFVGDGSLLTGINWNSLTRVPDGFADGVDDDTQYVNGPGLTLLGTQFYVGADAIDSTMISGLAWNKITGAPSSFPPNGAAAGDLTGTYPNPTLRMNAVSTADIQNLAVINAKINDVDWSKITNVPEFSLTLPYEGEGSATGIGALIEITNTGSGSAILGRNTAASGSAIRGIATSGANAGLFESFGIGTAVYAVVHGSSGFSTAVYGSTDSSEGIGCAGYSSAHSGSAAGGRFQSDSISGFGVIGYAASAGVNYGVFGQTNSSELGYGVFSMGRFGATGTKSFRIDHPSDPENKYLLHYCAEGPEPLNIYSGTVRTDKRGFATVELPDYYESVNRDARVQLTIVDESDSDEFVLAKVTKKISGNEFVLRTSQPNVEVFWEVKAVRNDLWVRRYGAPVELEKSDLEKGKYQHPELYGLPESRRVGPSQSIQR